MKLIMKSILIFFFVNIANSTAVSQDIVFVKTMYVSNEAIRVTGDFYSPGQNIKNFTNKDKVIYYAASIGVINPTKKKYDVRIICIDSVGKIIIQNKLMRRLSEFIEQDGKNVRINGQRLRLNPKLGMLVTGQIAPLEGGNDYYVKLYFDNKLIGITKFHYEVLK